MDQIKNSNFVISFVTLDDISCVSCASTIENQFKDEEYINVKINFATKKAQFEYDATKWNEAKIRKMMKSIGYPILSFTLEDNQNNTNIHEHDQEHHQEHMASFHQPKFLWGLNVRNVVDLTIGAFLLLPLLLAMIPNLPLLNNGYFQLAIATIFQFYIGRKFYFLAFKEVFKQKWPGMGTLIVLSTSVAYFFSIYLIASNNTGHLFFEVSASIIFIVLLGDLITDFVQTKATNGLVSLMNLNQNEVLLVDNITNTETLIKSEAVKINDQLIIRKGESIPVDGILLSQEAYIDESLLTGEANIISKTINESLIGGTINFGETFKMQAVKVGKETILANIIKSVEQTQLSKPKLQRIADKIAGWFTPTVILIAILVFLIRYLAIGDSPISAMETAIATLIIVCPCALGIATPLAVAVGTNKAAKLGVLYNSADAFEKISKIDTICFDKTGTLTEGQLSITSIYGNETTKPLAFALEKYSTHPLAKAFLAKDWNIADLPLVTEVKETIAFGMRGLYRNQQLVISSLNNLIEQMMPLSSHLSKVPINEFLPHQKVLALAFNNVIENIFLIEDKLQTKSQTLITQLQNKGIEVIIISGDQEPATTLAAQTLQITRYYFGKGPVEKATIIAELQSQGKKVAFVGDGINDIVALNQSDLAIVMGKGSDIAKQNGDITILNNTIQVIYQAIVLTKATKRTIWMNFAWAFGYNLIVIPLAAAGFIIPVLAAFAMAFSDLTVVLNSLIFKWRKT